MRGVTNISFVQKEGSKIVVDDAGELTVGCRWTYVIGQRVPNFDYEISEKAFSNAYWAKVGPKFKLMSSSGYIISEMNMVYEVS